MGKLKSLAIAACIFAVTPAAMANITAKTAKVDSYSSESANRVGDENNFYITATGGTWNVTTACSANDVYFNAKDNPHLVSIVIAAHATRKDLRIAVDSGKPQVRGMCQVVNLTVN